MRSAKNASHNDKEEKSMIVAIPTRLPNTRQVKSGKYLKNNVNIEVCNMFRLI